MRGREDGRRMRGCDMTHLHPQWCEAHGQRQHRDAVEVAPRPHHHAPSRGHLPCHMDASERWVVQLLHTARIPELSFMGRSALARQGGQSLGGISIHSMVKLPRAGRCKGTELRDIPTCRLCVFPTHVSSRPHPYIHQVATPLSSASKPSLTSVRMVQVNPPREGRCAGTGP